MTPTSKYDIEFRRAVAGHFESFKRHQIVEIRRAIEKQLEIEPTQKTLNRKLLLEEREHFEDSEWELRCGPGNRFRVFYRVDEINRVVIVIAIGVKIGNQLYIGGKEFP
jgi:hypothetical protein